MTPANRTAHRAGYAALISLLALLPACTISEQEPESQTPAAAAAVAVPDAAPPATPPAAGETPSPEIFFRAPADGAMVDATFNVVFGLRNYGVAPAGVKIPNTGHFHILIDVEPPGAGAVIPADSLHRHFGAGQIETWLTLAPGPHTLRLVLADADHRLIGPALVSAPIRITVGAR